MKTVGYSIIVSLMLGISNIYNDESRMVNDSKTKIEYVTKEEDNSDK